MLSNKYFLAKFRVGEAENEPAKMCNLFHLNGQRCQQAAGLAAAERGPVRRRPGAEREEDQADDRGGLQRGALRLRERHIEDRRLRNRILKWCNASGGG